ncbi:sm-like protein LSM36B isoform X2 [Actinidia eriantha]|uniref:sm-like protein LSM36B isoform X2 n=1 Tax=Actinidia eriantha TaxID=165200 RepID=UPI00258582B6|nr:sm-like protein LSM36B isoform X2 [Actinidia eriantha]
MCTTTVATVVLGFKLLSFNCSEGSTGLRFSCSTITVSPPEMSGMAEKGSATTKTPADFLKSIRGRPVVVKLNSGVDYRGILACLDGYMNIAMEQTEEYVNGQLKNKYGDAFIRGNNVLYISTSKRTLADGA